MGLKGNGSKILDTHRQYSGDSMKNSLAIAYNMKRKRKKMAGGGEAEDTSDSNKGSNLADTAKNFFSAAKSGSQQASNEPSQADKYDAIRKQNQANMGYAKGGEVESEISSLEEMIHKASEPNMVPDHVDYKLRPTQFDKSRVASNGAAMKEDDKDLNQRPVDMKKSTEDADDDLVMRIMHKRYSKGGQVANQDEEITGDMPNEFDVLHLDDDLESDYGDDDNSGDALGNDQEDEDRKDIVSRIMVSRKKKDRLPNPA